MVENLNHQNVTVKYRCSQCGAMDTDSGVLPPLGPLNCWKCKAGLGKKPEEMRTAFLGMYRTDDPIWIMQSGGSDSRRD